MTATESITVEALARALRVRPEVILQECRRNGLSATSVRSLLKASERQLVEHWLGRARPVGPRPSAVEPRASSIQSKVGSAQGNGALSGSQWARFVRARDAGSTLSGRVVEVVKGGLVLDLGARAFLPASQVDRTPVADLAAFVGSDLEVHIVEVDAAKRNLVVSRRSVLQLRSEQAAVSFFASVAPGDFRTAFVKAARANGIVVDVDGVEVFVKEQQLAAPPSSHRVGAEIEVAVCDIDREKRSVVLTTRLGSESVGTAVTVQPRYGPASDDPGAEAVHVSDTLLVEATHLDEDTLETALVEASRLGYRQVRLGFDEGQAAAKAKMRKAILSGRLQRVDRDRCSQTPDGFVVTLRADES